MQIVIEITLDLFRITTEIQTGSQEQALSTGEIVKNVERVRDIAERNAKLAEQLCLVGTLVLSQSQRLEQVVSVRSLPKRENNLPLVVVPTIERAPLKVANGNGNGNRS
ncbi:MAG: hypothetical protein AB1489_11645 [Acidobacteriota bacterium]